MPEVTDAQLAEYQRALTALNKMWENPEHGAKVKEAYAAVTPGVVIPEIETHKAQAVEARITEAETRAQTALDRLAERELADNNRREEDSLSRKIETATKKYRLTDEGRSTLIEQMKERETTDAESVAAWMVSEIPQPAKGNTSTFAPQTFDAIGINEEGIDNEALHRDPKKWFDKTVDAMLRDPEFIDNAA